MSFSRKTLLVGVLLGPLVGAGSVITYDTTIKNRANIENTTSSSPSATPALIGNIDSGYKMTPDQMYEELQRLSSGAEFDRKYLTYMILMKNLESGMSLIATEKATKGELSIAASSIREFDKPLVTSMFRWQKIWGYSHH